ncbi:serine/threonine-protein kinase [Congregibacter brevis]|uniref:Serine/threonine-protein kinase n=1 Tax=Congregibacter brevis TaxID=3081201 RepID=A0ABZ0IJC6_9GAMM|nr:serine/threonine-protein kinase [Congregibacter sp. IMCC45268]
MIRGLSQYRVLGRLGHGGQGEVYLALDTRLKRRVCIKLYYLSGSMAARRRAVLEARHLMLVESPQTVTIYDVVSAGGSVALVFQYIPGCTLEELLALEGRLSPENAMAVLTDLAAALAALRQSGLVHGDIKPANVLIDVQGRTVLTDFGSSLLAGEQWSSYSHESISPEQSRGEPAVLLSDFYALGLLMYRMLYGEHPFYDGGALDVRRMRGGLEAAPVLADLSPLAMQSIEKLLLSLLASRSDARPQSTFDLRERLREVRSRLPAPNLAEIAPQMKLQEPALGVANVRLPRKLVRLPVWQQGQAWLFSYWSRGSLGARGLIVAVGLAPIALVTLAWLAPGPCLALPMPQINIGANARMTAMNERDLRVLLSTLVKEASEDIVVLGAGPADDSYYTATPAGLHNSCIPQQSLSLRVDCEAGRCLLQLRSEKGALSQEGQLSVSQTASVLQLKQSLSQLLREQIGFLRS